MCIYKNIYIYIDLSVCGEILLYIKMVYVLHSHHSTKASHGIPVVLGCPEQQQHGQNNHDVLPQLFSVVLHESLQKIVVPFFFSICSSESVISKKNG